MTEVNCNACSGVFTPNIQTEREAEMEYQYFSCPYCGNPYVISVTDEELRSGIREYQKIGERIRREGSRRELVKLSTELLHRNAKRSRELMDRYPVPVWERNNTIPERDRKDGAGD